MDDYQGQVTCITRASQVCCRRNSYILFGPHGSSHVARRTSHVAHRAALQQPLRLARPAEGNNTVHTALTRISSK
jgi:hypothetical protein